MPHLVRTVEDGIGLLVEKRAIAGVMSSIVKAFAVFDKREDEFILIAIGLTKEVDAVFLLI